MKIKTQDIHNLYSVLLEISEQKIPFRTGFQIGRNLQIIEKEEDFLMQQEQKFIENFIETDPETGDLEKASNGAYKIKSGKTQECLEARKILDEYEVDINLHKIKYELFESLELTLRQITALLPIIDYEEMEEKEND